MATVHLDLLKQQIDRAKLDFGYFTRALGSAPTDVDYRQAVKYAHGKFNDRLERLIMLYDGLDYYRIRQLRNAELADGKYVTNEEVEGSKVERLCQEDVALNTDEEWIQQARKGGLQQELAAALNARMKVVREEDRVVRLRWGHRDGSPEVSVKETES
ncbi:hypothetical protein B0A50_01037 [Salinomyces thailandicus]|uniref:Uncharacterized protein n=1 Tax=Salinomyces thailandicus TaxID=706561 RepID=A0A4U0UDF4_9PEZI|nr:hypothetical protein B0A50_01037 [Salinomyces thailandica]